MRCNVCLTSKVLPPMEVVRLQQQPAIERNIGKCVHTPKQQHNLLVAQQWWQCISSPCSCLLLLLRAEVHLNFVCCPILCIK